MENEIRATYWFLCGELVCDEKYIRETSRTFGERFTEYLEELSHIHNHTIDHKTTQDDFQIIGRDDHGIARTIKESIYIRVNNATLNRNVGNFNLHPYMGQSGFKYPRAKNKWTCTRYSHSLGMLSAPNLTPRCIFSTGSVEHIQRTPLFEYAHRTS